MAKNGEPVEEGLVDAKNTDKSVAEDFEVLGEAEGAHELEVGKTTSEQVHQKTEK